MNNALQKMLSAGAFAAAMVCAAAVSAQTARVTPANAATQQGYIDPYAAYAYTPGLRVEPNWEFSGSFESKAGALRYRELHVRPGGPVDSCFLNRLVPDRC